MIDKKPAVIARCRDVADVISAIKFEHENGLAVAVRGGGHNGGGLGSVDNGLMIDLSLMRGVRVESEARTAQIGMPSVSKNKANILTFYREVMNKGRLEVLDELVSKDLVDHNAFPGQAPGREDLKPFRYGGFDHAIHEQ
jgi:hypothetical protein